MAGDISTSQVSTRRKVARWRRNLSCHAPILLVSLAAIALLTAFSGHVLAGLGCGVAVLGAALIAPQRMRKRLQPVPRAQPVAPGVPHPSAAELGAAIDDPLIVCDAQGTVLLANAAATRAFGSLATGEPIALRFRSPEMQDLIDRALRGDDRASVDYSERVPIERSFKVSLTRIGGGGRFALFFRDQSETRRIDRMRADFIANASHELRTPLASIAGFIETLRGPAKEDAAARERFLQIMQGQTGRMARLIDDLLSLSRLEMKPLAGADSKVDLARLVREVADSLGQMIRDNDLELDLDLPDEPVWVPANTDEIVQVVYNLVENACKYGHGGKSLDIKLENAADEARLSVRDHGPGIAPEHIPRLTERFYRADGDTSGKGTGLGLAIVKHILTRHKGRLTIKSQLGDGACFTVHLPLAKDPVA